MGGTVKKHIILRSRLGGENIACRFRHGRIHRLFAAITGLAAWDTFSPPPAPIRLSLRECAAPKRAKNGMVDTRMRLFFFATTASISNESAIGFASMCFVFLIPLRSYRNHSNPTPTPCPTENHGHGRDGGGEGVGHGRDFPSTFSALIAWKKPGRTTFASTASSNNRVSSLAPVSNRNSLDNPLDAVER